jgi:hypothetical protein
MPKDTDIVIDNFQRGIADSPHLGFADMRNVDIHSEPGVVKISSAATKQSGSTVTDLILWFATNPNNGDIFALGDSGKVYKSTDDGSTWSLVSGNTTPGNGNGMAIWKDYLFVARNTSLDVYGPLSSSPSWTNGWQTLTSDTQYHPMIAASDDLLYIGAGRYITSILETAGSTFAPGTSSTYNFTAQALDLPSQYRVKCLAELGNKLMIGTVIGAAGETIFGADIFPWRHFDNASSYERPIRFYTSGIDSMLVVNNSLYVVAGGALYITLGSDVQKIRDFRFYNSSIMFRSIPAGMTYVNNQLFIVNTASTSSIPRGVFSYKEGAMSFVNQNSAGVVSTGSIGAIHPFSGGFIFGWYDGTNYGIDLVASSNGTYANYTGYVDSQLIRVGSGFKKRTFSEIDWVLDRPLSTPTASIRLSYRTSLSASFATIATFSGDTYTDTSFTYNFAFPACDHIQIRAELRDATSNAVLTHPVKLREIRLR